MDFSADISLWLKVGGGVFTGLGSILLAWRVKSILKWVEYCLVSHENSILELSNAIDRSSYRPMINYGVARHLIDVKDKLGFYLLVGGFVLLGIGMLSNAASFLVAAN